MVPFVTVHLPYADGLVLINCMSPGLFGLKFIDSTDEVVHARAIDLMGALFDVNAMLKVDDNINIMGMAVLPTDDKSLELIKSDVNKFQYLAGEKARLAFKSFMDEKPESFKQLIKQMENEIHGNT